MKLLILEVTRGRTPWADHAAEEYLKRIRRFARIEERQIKPAARGLPPERARLDEADRTLAALAPGDRLVVLDERGEGLDTMAFRDLLALGERGDFRRLVFALGGPYGHHESTRRRADTVLTLSPMVLNHQVARVLLLEQIYRGFTLIRGIPYHH
jgi:23S rRNA (pseudouridine1915-N3)-methyltransferase